jgi:hypothetical protein
MKINRSDKKRSEGAKATTMGLKITRRAKYGQAIRATYAAAAR